jgi:DNA-binding transcriptional regulator YiaG
LATSEHTLRRWETGRTPLVSAFPKIVEFLGYEPWPKPTSLAGHIRAARWRRGLRIQDAAKLLAVDASTFWWWETGRKPHRLKDRARIADFVAGATGAPVGESIAMENDHRADQIADIGSMLRSRRRELGLTLESAAKLLGANTWTVLHWEHRRHAPACRFFPSVIRFLGQEPWPEPRSIADRLRAERLRRGLSCGQIAALLEVDEGSIGAWEGGDGPHHKIAKAKVEAFLTGSMRPWRRRRPRGPQHLDSLDMNVSS